MRELVHYGIVHDISDIFRSRESKQDAKKVERFHDVLGDYYTTLTGKLLDYHEENSFHRTYIEGYFDGELGDGPAIYIPARALHDLYNIPIMPTEHNGLRILALIYEERIIDEMEKGKKIPIKKYLTSNTKYAYLDLFPEIN